MKILLKNSIIVTKNDFDQVISHGWILINGNRISKIEKGQVPDEVDALADSVIDVSGCVILPGLINGHTHLSQGLMKNKKEPENLESWLDNEIRPYQKRINSKSLRLANEISLLENLKCGVTTIIQHHKITKDFKLIEETRELARRKGVRMVLMLGINDRRVENIPVNEFFTYISSCHIDSFFEIGCGPTTMIGCSDKLLNSVIKFCNSENIFFHIHIAETRKQFFDSFKIYNCSPIYRLSKLNGLSNKTHLVHNVWVNNKDLNLIGSSGATVVHCPTSNNYLQSGVLKLPEIKERNIPLIIGTDGTGSCYSQNLLSEMKFTGFLSKALATNSNSFYKSSEIITMVTRDAAKAIGREDIGHLTVNAKADLIVCNMNKLKFHPLHDIQTSFLYNASSDDIDYVMVDGKIIISPNSKNIKDSNMNHIITEIKNYNKQPN